MGSGGITAPDEYEVVKNSLCFSIVVEADAASLLTYALVRLAPPLCPFTPKIRTQLSKGVSDMSTFGYRCGLLKKSFAIPNGFLDETIDDMYSPRDDLIFSKMDISR